MGLSVKLAGVNFPRLNLLRFDWFRGSEVSLFCRFWKVLLCCIFWLSKVLTRTIRGGASYLFCLLLCRLFFGFALWCQLCGLVLVGALSFCWFWQHLRIRSLGLCCGFLLVGARSLRHS
nr:MAG TPA: hypothetical protein [Caudoviricetes sp.]